MKYLKQTISQFIDDDCPTMAAALAYYTVFSLPSLLLIIISVAGLVFGRQAVQGQISRQIGSLIGQGAANQVQGMVQHAGTTRSGSIGAALGIAALIFGATTAFIQLQSALNRTWQVTPDPNVGGVRNFVTKRLLSFGFILGLAFLLLVSLAISSALSATGNWIGQFLGGASGAVLEAANNVVAFVITAVLFGAMFKFLPDTHIRWRAVWIGGLATAVLFTVGKWAIGLYLGKSGITSSFGAAASLVIVILWVYYASMIVLLGAEFTQVWAEEHGHAIEPEPGAMKVVHEDRPADRRPAA